MSTDSNSRILSLDAVRGLVMILMALDHVRDFIHVSAASFSPTDLKQTSAILFFTRWITHFCLPVFMFSAGAGAFLWWRRGNHTKGELTRFLCTRGVWFIFLELTVMQFAYNFNISSHFLILLLILWIFGICMVSLGVLIHLPARALLVLGIAVVVLHNLLDPLTASHFGSAAWLWNLLHQPGIVMALGRSVLVTYTVLPWVAVMALGFCFGHVMLRDAISRRRIMILLSLGMTVLFVIIRSINLYGDPVRWSVQKSWVFTAMSFLNCTKYPASLDFLLMTLGPALLMLALLDRCMRSPSNPLVIFGRTPFFYFVLHFYLIHVAAVVMAYLRYGRAASTFIFNPLPSMGGPQQLFPAPFGYSLPVVYGVWVAIVLILFPVCRWFAAVKRSRRDWWLTYL